MTALSNYDDLLVRLSEGPLAGCADQRGWEDLAADAAAAIRALAGAGGRR